MNKLEGSFPQWLADLKIETIIFSDNRLSGSLPPSLLQSISLSVLALSRNNFSGQIPDMVGETWVMILMLTENNFSGSSELEEFKTWSGQQKPLPLHSDRTLQEQAIRRSPIFLRQSQKLKAFKPLIQRHLWIDPTKFWKS
ncbi:hypothetical protein ISN45_Aa03g002970 [Arabidopsis thaliana x Arabidopsis arenosa]|uniref:Uncharacterized protein n=1 Tax=Arabidopsis thaliana x Arabidopsis arenosa TaxID=1240361 RepID=A0A8T2AS87_9BRAS|nr:hypothetical protein ISN45_Aa03g002970 [Arabidopsis thaliana x Arabidopsis arenosa]